MSSLAERMQELKIKFGNHDQAWVKFVRDHRSEIINISTTLYLKQEDQITYRYRLNDYLRTMFFPSNATWIVFYINQLSSDIDFNNIGSILVPDVNKLGDIYSQYQTFITNNAQVDAKLSS